MLLWAYVPKTKQNKTKKKYAMPYVYQSDSINKKCFLIRMTYRNATDHLTTNTRNSNLPALLGIV